MNASTSFSQANKHSQGTVQFDYSNFFEGRQLEQLKASENEAEMNKYIAKLDEELAKEAEYLKSMSQDQIISYTAHLKISLRETEMKLLTAITLIQALQEVQVKLVETMNNEVGHKKSLNIGNILKRFVIKKASSTN